MIRTFLLLILSSISMMALSQDTREKVMEKRAREMHRVIGLADKEQWKKFIKENYTQRLIDKPMQAKVETSENKNSTSTSSGITVADNLESKAMLFERLHHDFANSKIVSIKPSNDKLEMVLKGEVITGTFSLTFDKNSPYLIDGLGIAAGD